MPLIPINGTCILNQHCARVQCFDGDIAMENEARALCEAAEAFQAACNELHKAQEEIATGEGGTPLLEEVEALYSERFRTLSREIYYLRKAMRAAKT